MERMTGKTLWQFGYWMLFYIDKRVHYIYNVDIWTWLYCAIIAILKLLYINEVIMIGASHGKMAPGYS